MAIPDKLVNTRAPQPVHDRLSLMARRKRLRKGTLHRDLLMEAMVVAEARDLYKTVGFDEIMRRLTRPTYAVHGRHATDEGSGALAQTESHPVLQP